MRLYSHAVWASDHPDHTLITPPCTVTFIHNIFAHILVLYIYTYTFISVSASACWVVIAASIQQLPSGINKVPLILIDAELLPCDWTTYLPYQAVERVTQWVNVETARYLLATMRKNVLQRNRWKCIYCAGSASRAQWAFRAGQTSLIQS